MTLVREPARFILLLLLATLFMYGGPVGQAVARAQSIDDSNEGPVEMPSESSPRATPPTPSSRPTGRKAAEKYMAPRGGRDANGEAKTNFKGQGQAGEHYLAVHVGAMVSDNAYKYGRVDSAANIGSWNFGVTYRIGEWINSMDLNARIDVQRFHLFDGYSTKISFLPLITFPDASSKFPLFFGVGAGLGVFASQIPEESALSFDYQLLGGARFFEVWPNIGLFIEGGMKNSVFLLSDGQINGLFVAAGGVFAF